MNTEQEDNFRLGKAVEFLSYCKDAENQARVALAEAVKRTKLAKDKHGTLFAECEERAVARKKAEWEKTR